MVVTKIAELNDVNDSVLEILRMREEVNGRVRITWVDGSKERLSFKIVGRKVLGACEDVVSRKWVADNKVDGNFIGIARG